MKTLNRTLSLVLVLVMVLGFFGVAGAAFKDQAEVKYTEAVEVMTGIGAIDGYADGTFNPKGAITREEAAKLVVYSILGKSIAEKLTVSATGFKDVAADRWSAPYISYLVSKGIINGMGDGTFAPTEKVTGYAMAKMMLVAAGYGAKGEFTGDGWELAIAVTGNKAGVFSGATGVDYTKPATREEATLYAFNGVTKTTLVSYNKLFDEYSDVTYSVWDTVNSKYDYYKETIGHSVYKLTKDSALEDGRSGFYWIYKNKAISSFVADDSVLATSTDGTTYTNLTTASNPKYIKVSADTPVKFFYQNKEASVTYPDAAALAANEATIQGHASKAGVIVNFIDTNSNGKYDVVSVIEKTVSQLSGDPIVKTTGAVTTVNIPGVTGSAVNADNISYPAGLKKGDTVLFYASAADSVTYVEKANVVVGKMTGYVGTTKIVIDGKAYALSGLSNLANFNNAGDSFATTGTATISSAVANKADVAFFLDNNGGVAHFYSATPSATAENALYVIDASATAALGGGFDVKALVLLADGSTKTVSVAKMAQAPGAALDKVTSVNVAANLAANVLAKNTFYTYTVTDTGAYNLTAVEAYAGANHPAVVDPGTNNVEADLASPYTNVAIGDTYLKIVSGDANFLHTNTATAANAWVAASAMTKSGILANSETVFVLKTATGFKTYKGISNVPSTIVYTKGATIDVMKNASTGYAAFVVVSAANKVDSNVATSEFFFVLGAPTVVADPDGAYATVNVLMNGEPKVLKMTTGVATTTAITNGKAWRIDAKTGDIVSAVSAVGTTGAATKAIKVSGGTLSTYSDAAATTLVNSFVLNANVKCYVLNITAENFDPIAVEGLPMTAYGVSAGVTVTTVPASATDSTIVAVFITIA